VMRSLRSLSYNGWNDYDDDFDNDGERTGAPKPPPAWRELLLGPERPLESLTILPADAQGELLPALATCSNLPQLTELVLIADPGDVVSLFDAPVLRRLRRLALHFDTYTAGAGNWLDTLAPLLASAPVPHLAFHIKHSDFHPTLVKLLREDSAKKRAYARAEIEVGPTTRSNWSGTLIGEVIDLIRAIPGLAHLNVKLRRSTENEPRARLDKAVKALKLETYALV
jgi:hypothetical protein